MRNHSRKVTGTSKVTKTHVGAPAMGLLNRRKHQRLHQEGEVYHRLYKEKLEALAKAALAERLPDRQSILNGSEDDNESDSDSDGDGDGDDNANALSKGKTSTESSSVKSIRALRMKIRREVRADAWANETEDVRHEVREAMKKEREELAEFKGEEGKVGLERSPESREL